MWCIFHIPHFKFYTIFVIFLTTRKSVCISLTDRMIHERFIGNDLEERVRDPFKVKYYIFRRTKENHEKSPSG